MTQQTTRGKRKTPKARAAKAAMDGAAGRETSAGRDARRVDALVAEPMASIYGSVDPAEIPAYTQAEAAAIVGVPVSTLQKWVKGRKFQTKTGTRTSAPIIVTPDTRFLSFTNMVEAHVLAGLRSAKIALEKIRTAVHYVERHFKVKHALAREQFKTDGVDLFVERLGQFINASRDGQCALREVIIEHLRRVEYDKGRAVRFFPLHREQAPRLVVVDPRRAFGRPVLVGTSVPITDIASRFHHGDDIDQLASDYEVTPSEIEEAIRAARSAA